MMNDPAIGKEVDGFRIQKVLGRGGMGVVYKAEDVALSRAVALKSINPELASDESFLRRFRSEARALARIDSPYITRIHALRQTDLGLLIVMEYVEGGTLADALNQGPMPWSEAQPITEQMLAAFDHAHGADVIHRDIKPRNIMLTPDRQVKVTDFGLAKMRQRGSQATVTQGVAGTINYMSPEQVQGESNLDSRSDLFSFGLTLYETLTGQLPFDRDAGDFTKMRAITEEEFTPPDRLQPDLPKGLSAVVMKALEKDPDQRYQNAEAMRKALDALQPTAQGRTAAAASEERPAATRRSTGSTRLVRIGLASIALVALLAGAYYFFTSEHADAPVKSSLTVATTPTAARVSVNGSLMGKTPLNRHAVPQGTVSVLIQKAGYIPVDTTLHLADGRGEKLKLQLAPTSDSAPVEAVGEQKKADAGAEPDERKAKETSNPEPGRSQTKEEAKAKEAVPTVAREATATVTLRAAPSGAVAIDDGPRKPSRSTFTVAPGSHTIHYYSQYGNHESTISLSANQSKELTYYFQQTVSVNTGLDDPWGSIWVNGERTGKSTPDELQLGPGTYRISVRVERSEDYTVTGGAYRIETNGEQHTSRFSGGTRKITVKPSFQPTNQALLFQVDKNTP